MVVFLNDTATTEIYTLSLHDALPISLRDALGSLVKGHLAGLFDDYTSIAVDWRAPLQSLSLSRLRSEEHTSELPSRPYLVCRLLLEKKKITESHTAHYISSS